MRHSGAAVLLAFILALASGAGPGPGAHRHIPGRSADFEVHLRPVYRAPGQEHLRRPLGGNAGGPQVLLHRAGPLCAVGNRRGCVLGIRSLRLPPGFAVESDGPGGNGDHGHRAPVHRDPFARRLHTSRRERRGHLPGGTGPRGGQGLRRADRASRRSRRYCQPTPRAGRRQRPGRAHRRSGPRLPDRSPSFPGNRRQRQRAPGDCRERKGNLRGGRRLSHAGGRPRRVAGRRGGAAEAAQCTHLPLAGRQFRERLQLAGRDRGPRHPPPSAEPRLARGGAQRRGHPRVHGPDEDDRRRALRRAQHRPGHRAGSGRRGAVLQRLGGHADGQTSGRPTAIRSRSA